MVALRICLVLARDLLNPPVGSALGTANHQKPVRFHYEQVIVTSLDRSGTKDAQVYLVSPETAAAAVITGKITDPRDLEKIGIKYPKMTMPKKFYIDDSMFIIPPADP